MAVFSAVASAVSAVAAWTITIGSVSIAAGHFVLQAAVALGVSALQRALMGDPAKARFEVKGSVRTGGAVDRSIMLGRGLTAGSLVYHTEWTGQAGRFNYYTQVIALSDLPVKGLVDTYIDGKKITLGAGNGGGVGYPIATFTTGGVVYAWLKFIDGNQLESDFYLRTTIARSERPWPTSRIGRGVAYAIVTFRVNEKLFQSLPSCKFVLDGVPLYDVSRDTSAGGDGPQRLSDPSTWGGDGDDLPAVQAYNILLGMRLDGAWVYGMQGVTAPRLPAANWISQINKCRATVEGAAGPEPLYRAGGEVPLTADAGDVLDELMTTCSGRIVEVGAHFKIYVGAPDAPVASFTDGDIISLAQQSFTPFPGLAETVNGVSATFPNPETAYEMEATPTLLNADLEAADGGRRLLTSVPMPMVPYAEQAQRLVKAELNAARRARRHTLTLPPEFYRLEPGDVVSWASDRNGYAGKLFRVDGVIDTPTCEVTLDLTEVDAADHGDFQSAVDYVPPSLPQSVPITPVAVVVAGFSVSSRVIPDSDGAARLPAIDVSWDTDIDGMRGLRFQVRLTTTGEIVADVSSDNFADGTQPISEGIVSGASYEVRAIYLPNDTGLLVDWTAHLAVAAPVVAIPASALGADVIALIDQAGQSSGEATQTAIDARDAALAAAGDAQGSADLAQDQVILAAKYTDAARGGDPIFEGGLGAVTHNNNLPLIDAPDAYSNLAEGPSTDPAVGGLDIISTGGANVYSKFLHPIEPDRIYQVRARVRRVSVGAGDPRLFLGFTNTDQNFAPIAGGGSVHSFAVLGRGLTLADFPVGPDFVEFTSDPITGVGLGANQFRAGAVYARPYARLNYAASGAGHEMRLSAFWFEDITDRVELSARITSTETAIANAELAASISEDALIAELDEQGAAITETSVAVVNIQSGLDASYVLKAVAGDAQGSFGLFASDGVDGDPVSSAVLSADYISFNGGMALFENTELLSDNYQAGVSGWRIDQSGNAQFNDLEVTGEMLVPSAVTRQVYDHNDGFLSSSGPLILSLMDDDLPNNFKPYVPKAGPGSIDFENPVRIDIALSVSARDLNGTDVYFALRGRRVSDGGWEEISSVFRSYVSIPAGETQQRQPICDFWIDNQSTDRLVAEYSAYNLSMVAQTGAGVDVGRPRIAMIQLNR